MKEVLYLTGVLAAGFTIAGALVVLWGVCAAYLYSVHPILFGVFGFLTMCFFLAAAIEGA